MTRKRWVYFGTEAVEVSHDYVAEPRNSDAVLWNDRSYTELGDPRFHSRSSHREYMRARGLTTADDFTEQWKRDAQARKARAEGVDASRKADIAESIHKLNAGYKPRRQRQ